MGKYRYSIGTNRNFGNEIELINKNIDLLLKSLLSKEIPVRYQLNHKFNNPTYDKWILDRESTVYCPNNMVGCELSSRILIDSKECWKELEKICQILIENSSHINETCSNQTTIDLSYLNNEGHFFEVFSKVIALYEAEIETFYMGDYYFMRPIKKEYAKNVSFALLRKVNNIDFKKDNFMNDLMYSGIETYGLRDAINLSFYDEKHYKNAKTMEIKYGNGTLNKKTIQNNINFILKLVNAIEKEKFDKDYLTFLIDIIDKNNATYEKANRKPLYKNFENIVSTISTSSEDEDDFLSQYEKVLKKSHR